MEVVASHHAQSPWKHTVVLVLLQLCCAEAGASCLILSCNSDFVAATLNLGGGDGEVGPSYCSALRSYATCTKRMARACRGDLAFHSAVQGIEDLLIQHRCPRVGPTARPRPLPQAPLAGEACVHEHGFLRQNGHLPMYAHCGVFGDAHIRTFNNDFQTCNVRGAWPLIDNDFLYVQVTSRPVGGATHAMALSKVTVIFKAWRQCLEQQVYQAELDHVPAAFADGSVSSGERRGLLISSQDVGRHARIHATHIGTVLVVRQSGRSLGLAVRAPRAIVEAFSPIQDLQLCVWGCPASMRVLSTPSSAGARDYCAGLLPARDVYYQACVFDLQATGHTNASLAAVAALEDAREMVPEEAALHLQPLASAQQAGLDLVLLVLLLHRLLEVLESLWNISFRGHGGRELQELTIPP